VKPHVGAPAAKCKPATPEIGSNRQSVRSVLWTRPTLTPAAQRRSVGPSARGRAVRGKARCMTAPARAGQSAAAVGPTRCAFLPIHRVRLGLQIDQDVQRAGARQGKVRVREAGGSAARI
jgi:hypothetical protein